MSSVLPVDQVEQEFEGCELGDPRRGRRLVKIARKAALDPSASFPSMCGKEVNRLYEFLGSEHVDSEGILEAHFDQTRRRCAQAGEVYAVHDTTEFEFLGDGRTGLGPISGGGSEGFLGHFALAASPTGCPLGVLGFYPWVRPAREPGRSKKKDWLKKYKDPNKESARWIKMVETVEERMRGTGSSVVHIADREADDYAFINTVTQPGRRFVIRIRADRTLAAERDAVPARLFAAMDAVEGVMTREVPISKRGKRNNGPKALRTHPARNARAATLKFSATSVTLQCPRGIVSSGPHLPATLSVNVVRVFEPNPPDGEPAVEWRLMTTEPISSADEVAHIVDIYRGRWIIEEFFKALKTGCQVENRQLEQGRRLVNATALLVPLAYLLLLLRATARVNPDASASTVITDTQLQVLNEFADPPLPPHPTVRHAMFAIAALAGHLKRNGDPGWKLLGEGYQRLLLLERGFVGGLAARARQQNSRQS